MLIFLIRHAHADSGEPDEARALSDRGRREARKLADALSQHANPPVLVLTSPLLRARQTAEEIAHATSAELRTEPALGPGATLDALRETIGGETRAVAVVCHQPDCSEIAVSATGTDPGFSPGGMAELRLEA
ncbi:MAG: histidine phosphatase family protein [Actinobacteria bacterium]|nr:histidine phosphatase family protein [Actinomycetota bacterium]